MAVVLKSVSPCDKNYQNRTKIRRAQTSLSNKSRLTV
jgi:hypothetical protein